VKRFHLAAVLWVASCTAPCWAQGPEEFYVDPARGSDDNPGAISAPFQSLRHALGVVSRRVEAGILSDKILLRGGVYKVDEALEDGSLYRLNLKGTPDDYAELSAMSAEPHAPGAVQRKSGKWYERVVFDDGYRIPGPWERYPGNPKIWMTQPGYVKMKWWPDYAERFGYKDRHFPVSQFIVLQDGRALYWSDRLDEKTDPFCIPKFIFRRYPGYENPMGPGRHTYDVETDTLYVWPYDDEDPNAVVLESWNRISRRRHLFSGDMEHAAVRGMEFRLVRDMFRGAQYSEPFKRCHVLWEDTDFFYAFRALVMDVRGANFKERRGDKFPSYANMSHWHIRHNRMYRTMGECVQIFGVGHIFEHNEIIRRGHPCGSPIAWVSSCNWRNCLGVIVRGNYVYGNAMSDERGKGSGGYTFLIETHPPYELRGMPVLRDYPEPPPDGEHCFEYNIFINCSADSPHHCALLELGKSTGQLHHVTIRNNIFVNAEHRTTIGISTPHENLRIHNNIFYNLPHAIGKSGVGGENRTVFGDLPSTVSIRGNMFVNCEGGIDDMLTRPKETDEVVIDRNLFFNTPAAGARAITGKDPLFRDPDSLDFRVRPASPAIVPGHDIGVYDDASSVPQGADWWKLAEQGVNETPINRLPGD